MLLRFCHAPSVSIRVTENPSTPISGMRFISSLRSFEMLNSLGGFSQDTLFDLFLNVKIMWRPSIEDETDHLRLEISRDKFTEGLDYDAANNFMFT
jgi:hypothetical protein